MHPRVIALRQSDAFNRVKAATKQIAELSGVDAPDLAGIREKSPDVQRVKEFEAFADWLERLAVALPQIDDLPSIDDLTIAQIKKLSGFTVEQWERLFVQENTGKQRKMALEYLQAQLQEAANVETT